MKKAVVLIHGLLARAYVMRFMHKTIENAGYKVYSFDYKSLKYSKDTLERLHDFIFKISEKEIYMIGHSMGGLVARNYIHQYKNEIKGLVTIATPHNQSVCAHNAVKRFRRLFGSAGESGLTIDIPAWNSDAPIGCIAGKSKGVLYKNFFLIFYKDDSESDGTVFLREAIMKDCNDSIVMKGAHTALIFNADVVRQCIHFIENKEFQKEKPTIM